MITLVNETQKRVSKKQIQLWVNSVFKEIVKNKIKIPAKELVIVFVSEKRMTELNYQFRRKRKSTDVLSFQSEDPSCLGELVLCYPVLLKQSKIHGMTVQSETFYMILHGILHLLGYEHEGSSRKAKRMFKLQDSIWNRLGK